MNQSTALKANIGFGLVLAFIAAMACLSYQGARRLAEAGRSAELGYQAVSCFQLLQAQLKEAQSIQLAYAVGRSQPIADRFIILKAEIADSLSQATQLTAGNKPQQARLKAVSPVLKTRLRLTGENPQVITWLQTQVGAAERDQGRLLKTLRQADQAEATRARTFIFLTGLLSIGLFVGAGVTVKRVAAGKRALGRELMQARQLAEAANQIRNSLAKLSHEIRTAINGVLGMLDVLMDTPLSSEQKSFAHAAKGCADSLLRVINDALDFSKVETGKLDFELIDFNLRDAVEEALELLAPTAAQKRIELAALIETDVPVQLHGDPRRLRQVLTSLVVNGIQFSQQGEVTVRARKEGETETHVTLRFEVKDTGVGISKEVQERLFQTGVRPSPGAAGGSTPASAEHSGAGLALCQQLVALMSGQIGVTSAPGAGSTFWFTVIIEKQRHTGTPVSAGELEGVRVLVVDDNFTNREVLYHQTKSWNMRTDTASDADSALRLLRDASATDPYRIAILDQQMDQKDGLALAQEIKSDDAIADTRLVLLSSLGICPEGTPVGGAGFDACLLKPVKQSRLMECLMTIAANLESPGVRPSSGADAFAPPAAPALARSTHAAGPKVGGASVPASLPSTQAGGASVPTSPRPPKSDEGRVPERPPLKILVVEEAHHDDVPALTVLTKLGYDADVVRSAGEVLLAVEFFQYDVVLIDFTAEEIDGYEITRQIREQEKNIAAQGRRPVQVIAITEGTIERDRELCQAAGLDAHLNKPLRPDDLQATLEKAESIRRANLDTEFLSSPSASNEERAATAGVRGETSPASPNSRSLKPWPAIVNSDTSFLALSTADSAPQPAPESPRTARQQSEIIIRSELSSSDDDDEKFVSAQNVIEPRENSATVESADDLVVAGSHVLDFDPTPAQDPPIDRGRLEQLSAGDPEQLRAVIDRYLREAEQMMSGLGSAVLESSAPEIEEWAHKLAEASDAAGATAMVPPLRQMEELARSGDLSTSQEVFSQISYELGRTESFLSEHLPTVEKS
jgi:signal transduction histidine kinase/CheY-like chemotaxis protein/HPt (histidine-containing phosphotransfer) domain-containing protein